MSMPDITTDHYDKSSLVTDSAMLVICYDSTQDHKAGNNNTGTSCVYLPTGIHLSLHLQKSNEPLQALIEFSTSENLGKGKRIFTLTPPNRSATGCHNLVTASSFSLRLGKHSACRPQLHIKNQNYHHESFLWLLMLGPYLPKIRNSREVSQML